MSYAGDLTPQQAWDKLKDGAILVDVRTEAEWAHIGRPKAPSGDPLFIQWNLAGGVPNQGFLTELAQQAPEAGTADLVFLCRSGQRSIAAAEAATAAGWSAYNVLEGFEGVPDRFGERTVNGWKNSGLPTTIGA